MYIMVYGIYIILYMYIKVLITYKDFAKRRFSFGKSL